MRKYVIFIFFNIVHLIYASDGGNVGFAFLKNAVNARASAMGEAHTALAFDAAATYWNPANLTQSKSNSILLSHNSWLLDITHNFAAIHLIRGTHNIAFSFNIVSIPGIEIRDYTASKEPIGKSSAYNLYFAAAYATEFSESWSLGAQLKYYYEKMYLVSANGIGLDLGIFKKDLITHLDWGFSLQNLGQMSKLLNESTKLPLTFRTGIGYELPWKIVEQNIIAAADVVYIPEDAFRFNVGAETKILNQLALRLGYVLGADSYSFTTGFGLQFSRYELSYAFVPYKYDLENSHRITFIIKFD